MDPDGRCAEGGIKGYTLGSFAEYDNVAQTIGGFIGIGLSYITPGLGEVALARDVAGSAWHGLQAAGDIYSNGLNWGNGIELGSSVLGVGLGGWAANEKLLSTTKAALRATAAAEPATIREASATLRVFRQGTFADESVGWEGNVVKGHHWSVENPLTTPNYARKYGLPAENTGKPDWVVGGRLQGEYTTRPSPPSHNNPLNIGEGREIILNNPNDVMLDFSNMDKRINEKWEMGS